MQEKWVAHYHQHPFTDSMLERLLHSTTLTINEYPHGLDGSPATSGDALSSYPHLHATCIVPLRTEERILGTLELGSTAHGTYANSTVQRLISAVAQVLATAIERSQLEGNAGIQDRQRQALKDVSRALTSEMDLSTILTHITDGVAKALNVSSAIVTLDQRESCLQLVAQSGLDETVLHEIISSEEAMTDQCILGRTLRHWQSYISNDIESDERFPASHVLTSTLAIRSVLSYPLVIGNTNYGALLLCSQEPGGFTPLKADIVALFATQATIAIHNGILLQAAWQHHRFQTAIEQLEQMSSSLSPSHSQEEEYALLAYVQEETQRTFGVSLSSILRFVSDNLLTKNDYDIQMLLHKRRDAYSSTNKPTSSSLKEAVLSFSNNDLLKEHEMQRDLFTRETLSLLTQTTQTALARTGAVSELSKLLMQLQQPTNGIKDAWFVTDLAGTCIYMNPVAEMFCGMHVMERENTFVSLEQVFAGIIPRIRNTEEVRRYVQDFTFGNLYTQELRCSIASEPLYSNVTVPVQQELYARNTTHEWADNHYEEQVLKGVSQLSTTQLQNASTDSHYQFTRHLLHNQQGELTAYALQVRDITAQARDEKNKAALLSSVSHDLRTPLTTIKAAVTGLLQTDLPWDEQMRHEMLEDIDAETDHLTVLVNALVEMSRIEMGALILEKEWCDISEVFYETLTKAKRVIAGRNVQTQFQTSLPLLYVDHVQLGRVFYNLLENAACHSPEQAEIIIKADVLTDESVPAMVRIRIIDGGHGIPEHEHEHIFKSFYGLPSHGSGLGLAICKGIIEAHQGRIWVESSEKGSCFIFTLPMMPQ